MWRACFGDITHYIFEWQIDVLNTTLGDLVTRVIKAKLGFNAPSIMLGSSGLYEEGEGADEDLAENLPLKLAQCPAGGVVDGAQLQIEDFTQNLEVRAQYALFHASCLMSSAGHLLMPCRTR
jgi:hypothetical protein